MKSRRLAELKICTNSHNQVHLAQFLTSRESFMVVFHRDSGFTESIWVASITVSSWMTLKRESSEVAKLNFHSTHGSALLLSCKTEMSILSLKMRGLWTCSSNSSYSPWILPIAERILLRILSRDPPCSRSLDEKGCSEKWPERREDGQGKKSNWHKNKKMKSNIDGEREFTKIASSNTT